MDFKPGLPAKKRTTRYSKSYKESRSTARGVEITHQANAPVDLKVISQPQDVPLESLEVFTYDSRAGSGITIYALDTGANKQNPVRKSFHNDINSL